MDADRDLETPPAARWLAAGTFSGRTAVVTGGGTGLGAEVSRGLAALGAHVVIASRSAEHHAALLDEARAGGWSLEALVLDVREPVAVERAALALAERGGVDLLVNNAAGNFLCPAERLSARAWTGMPGVVHSASAKAGVLAMTRTLAVEWARFGIRVNAIAPGPFESEGAAARLWPEESMRRRLTEQIPLGRMAGVGEVAAQCLHLLSPASEYVNGECLVVDGGASLGQNLWMPGERRPSGRGPPQGDGGRA